MTATAVVRGQLVGYRRILGLRDYRLLWYAQVVSTFGDRLTQIGLTTLVFAMTGSELSIGLVLTLTVLPRAALGLFAGALADRVSRKVLLVTTDCVRAVIVLALALAAGLPLGLVYALAALHATATVFFTPTRYAVIPDIVPEHQLLDANTFDEMSQGALDPLAYLAGGALVAGLGVRSGFGIDSLTFLVSASLIIATTARGAAQWHARRATVEGLPDASKAQALDISAGLRAIWRDNVLRANILLVGMAAVIASADGPLTYMLVFTHWRRGAMGLGIFEAALALGFVVGAFACAPIVERIGRGPAILVGLLCTGLSMSAVAVLPFWPAAVLNGVSGAFNILFFVPSLTLTQERVSPEVRGRVLSARSAMMAVALVVSYASATALTSLFEPRLVMLAMGILLALGIAVASPIQVLRQR
jgi:MFS transporter, DHA3 family, macrolide efflux protein